MPFIPDAQPAAPTGRFVPDAPPAPPNNSVGHNLLGEGELAGAGLVNLLPNAGNAAVDLYRRVSGGNTDAAPPFPTMKVGQAGQDLVRNVAGLTTPTGTTTLGQGVSQAAGAADAALGRVSPTLQDVVHQTGGVLSDVANLAPVAGVVGKAASLGESAASAPLTAVEQNVARAGYAPTPLQRATQAGFQIAPNDVPRSTGTPINQVPGRMYQNMGETPGTVAARRQANVTQATQMAAQDIRLPQTDQVTPEHIDAAKQAAGAVRDQIVEAAGPANKPVLPQTSDALEAAMDENRSQQSAAPKTVSDMGRMLTGLQSGNYQGGQILNDVQYLRDDGSPAALKAARALEDEFENQTQDQPALLGAYKDNREQFAKIYDVENSLKNNRVDPQALLRQRDTWERPLTGGLAEIAHAASVAPNSVSMPGAVVGESSIPLSKVGMITSAAKSLARKVVPDLSTPNWQSKIAASAGAPGALPSTSAPANGLGAALAGSLDDMAAAGSNASPRRNARRVPDDDGQ